MPKRNIYYAKDENGEWTQITKVPESRKDIHQLSFNFDTNSAASMSEDFSGELTFNVNPDDIENLESDLELNKSDDIYDTLLDEIERMRICWLDAMYYINRAKTISDVRFTDRITCEEINKRTNNILMMLDDYKKSCMNEYICERNQILVELTAKNVF